MEILNIKNITKVYGQGQNKTYALNKINLIAQKGEFISIMGTSGSGKSTLLNIISGLDVPSSGEVYIKGKKLSSLSDKELTNFRRHHIGFIFQFFNLIPVLSTLENVTLPAILAGKHLEIVEKKAQDLLNLVDIGHLSHSKPSEMSGGQQQRVSIARALLNEPEFILADEPTGSLDSKTSKEILCILKNFCVHMNHTLIMVTHDAHVASYADRVLFMHDGKIVNELYLSTSEHDRQKNILDITSRIERLSQ